MSAGLPFRDEETIWRDGATPEQYRTLADLMERYGAGPTCFMSFSGTMIFAPKGDNPVAIMRDGSFRKIGVAAA